MYFFVTKTKHCKQNYNNFKMFVFHDHIVNNGITYVDIYNYAYFMRVVFNVVAIIVHHVTMFGRV